MLHSCWMIVFNAFLHFRLGNCALASHSFNCLSDFVRKYQGRWNPTLSCLVWDFTYPDIFQRSQGDMLSLSISPWFHGISEASSGFCCWYTREWHGDRNLFHSLPIRPSPSRLRQACPLPVSVRLVSIPTPSPSSRILSPNFICLRSLSMK